MTWKRPLVTLLWLSIFSWFCLFKFDRILCLFPLIVIMVMVRNYRRRVDGTQCSVFSIPFIIFSAKSDEIFVRIKCTMKEITLRHLRPAT